MTIDGVCDQECEDCNWRQCRRISLAAKRIDMKNEFSEKYSPARFSTVLHTDNKKSEIMCYLVMNGYKVIFTDYVEKDKVYFIEHTPEFFFYNNDLSKIMIDLSRRIFEKEKEQTHE